MTEKPPRFLTALNFLLKVLLFIWLPSALQTGRQKVRTTEYTAVEESVSKKNNQSNTSEPLPQKQLNQLHQDAIPNLDHIATVYLFGILPKIISQKDFWAVIKTCPALCKRGIKVLHNLFARLIPPQLNAFNSTDNSQQSISFYYMQDKYSSLVPR